MENARSATLREAELWTADARLAREVGDGGPVIRVLGAPN